MYRYITFLANVNSRLSVVCNAHAHYSGGCNFGQFFYGIWYVGLDMHRKFYGDRPRGNPPSGKLTSRGVYSEVAKYSDFGPIEGYISETVQDRK